MPTTTTPWRQQWNLPNAITATRIATVPFFVWALLVDGGASETWRWVATAIFAVSASTDKLDGYLARRRNLVTDLGKLLDPIADKALVGTALVGLSIIGELWWWVTALILVRELGITVMRFFMLRYVVLPASRGASSRPSSSRLRSSRCSRRPGCCPGSSTSSVSSSWPRPSS